MSYAIIAKSMVENKWDEYACDDTERRRQRELHRYTEHLGEIRLHDMYITLTCTTSL